ncbi:hypothetical protein COMA2_190063 [Candidatus Nitrospira nitrificans]|uniref:Uncharacterized protein n=1 Tax=Candidatus Nitrospira nitrificans TaxID=1742973 RepID=A0A0S4LDA7_9BACT|nr:hypothetical protein COMA2_190063 [Candidatus Nitrospira nitrificans]
MVETGELALERSSWCPCGLCRFSTRHAWCREGAYSQIFGNEACSEAATSSYRGRQLTGKNLQGDGEDQRSHAAS